MNKLILNGSPLNRTSLLGFILGNQCDVANRFVLCHIRNARSFFIFFPYPNFTGRQLLWSNVFIWRTVLGHYIFSGNQQSNVLAMSMPFLEIQTFDIYTYLSSLPIFLPSYRQPTDLPQSTDFYRFFRGSTEF